MQARLQVLFDAFALLIAKASFIGLRLLTMYLCAISVAPAEFGQLALALTTAEVCRYIADWGTDTWSLRCFSDPDVSKARGYFFWVFRLRVLSSFAGFIGSWFCIGLFAHKIGGGGRIFFALTTITSLWLNLGVNWLQARSSLRPVAVILAIFGSVCAISVFGLHVYEYNSLAMLATLVCFELVLAAGVIGIAVSNARGEIVFIRSVEWRRWFKEATPIALAALIVLSYGRFDQYFVGTRFQLETVGSYLLALRLVEPLQFVAAAFSSTLYARASSVFMAEDGLSIGRDYCRKWIRLVLIASTAIALAGGAILTAIAPHVLTQYNGLMMYVWIALLCTIFRSTNLAMTAFIQAHAKYGLMFCVSLFNGMVIFLGIFGFGTFFGPKGAALAVCLGEGINMIIQKIILRRILS